MADLNFVLNLKDNATVKVKQFGEQIDKATKKGEGLDSALGDIGGKLKGMTAGGAVTAGVTALGAAFAGTAFAAIKTADAMTELWRGAQRAGTSVEFLSSMQLYAAKAGVEFDDLRDGLTELNLKAYENNEAWKELGINVKDNQGNFKDVSILLAEVADKFQGMEDGAKKAWAADQLLGGDVGSRLVPMLNKGAEGIKEFTAEAEKMGLVVTDSQAQTANALKDKVSTIGQTLNGMFTQVGAAAQQDLIPVLDLIGEILQGWGPIFAKVAKGLAVTMRWTVGIFEGAAGAVAQVLTWLVQNWDRQLQIILKGVNAVRGFFGQDKIEVNFLRDLGKQFQTGADAIFESAVKRFQDPKIEKMSREIGGGRGGKGFETKVAKAQAPKQVSETEIDFAKIREERIAKSEKAISEIYLNSLDVRVQASKTEEERLMAQQALDLERLRQDYEAKRVMAEEAGVSTIALLQQQAVAEQAILDQTEAKKKELHQAEIDRIQTEKEAKQDLAMAYFNVARQMFPKIKSLAIAEALMSGAIAVQRALAAPPGFPFNAFQVGLASAQTLANVNTIRQQRFALGGMIQGSNVLIRANENGQEAVVNARATRVLGSDGVRAINEGRFADLVQKLTGTNSNRGGGISISISGGLVDKRFVERELLPTIKSALARA